MDVQLDMRWSFFTPLALVFPAILAACGGGDHHPEATPVTSPEPEHCGSATGAWSEAVDGLRGRLVASRDGDELQITLELENVSAEALEIHWAGRPDVGFASFALDDASGTEIPEPDWRFGGNEPGGFLCEILEPSAVVRRPVPIDIFTRPDGVRVVRIGAFWGRELPAVASHVYLRARVSGPEPSDSDTLVAEQSEDGTVTVRAATSSDPRGRVWNGPLSIPSVCIQ